MGYLFLSGGVDNEQTEKIDQYLFENSIKKNRCCIFLLQWMLFNMMIVLNILIVILILLVLEILQCFQSRYGWY
jgi:hypothetical protein